MIERVRADLSEHPLNEGTLLFRTRGIAGPLNFEAALSQPGMSVIAEVKRASPSAGPIAEADPAEVAQRYERGGAAAISILTQPRFFEGSLIDLRRVRRRTALPLLRKDFLVHPSQVIQSRTEGADAVLLIAATALGASELQELRLVAEDLGMSALVEAHSPEGIQKALDSGARVIGVNARDLESLDVDFDRALALAGRVPSDRILVIESGIHSRRQVERAEEAGAAAILVGETLMRSEHPEVTIRRLLGALSVAPTDAGRGW